MSEEHYNKLVYMAFSVIIAAAYLALFFFTMVLSGCVTPHPQEGGGSKTTLPAITAMEPPAVIEMKQPENPEGQSATTYEESRTILHPDGRVETIVRKTGVTVGGSQDYAKILKEYAASKNFRGVLFALLLMGGALMAYRREWPLVAGILAVGGFCSLFFAWWAGALAVLAAAGLYIGYKIALPISPNIIQ